MTTTTGRPRSAQQDGLIGTGEPDLVLPLQEATDLRLAGRKAATLAVLAAAGCPVPPGVVLSTTAFGRAVAAGGGGPDPCGLRVPDDVGAALASAVARWGDVPLAVRSSAVDEDLADASYAGLYTTVLDVRGTAALLDAVRRCWESASSTGIVAYRQAREERYRTGMAVLVQPMLRPAAAGVAFTADPVTGERDVVVIDAVPGTAEALVSGEETPERWAVRGSGPELSGPRPGSPEPVLTPGLASAVADLARQVEAHRGGRSQDVEWAVEGDRVWLLQARPVTGLPDRPPTPVEVPVEVPGGFWVRESTHSALPWTRMTREVLAPRNRGLRKWAEDTGLLIDGGEVRDIGGWEYVRIVPLGGKEPPPLPAWAAPIAFRVVPAVRRRTRQAAAAARDDIPMQLLRRWSAQWRPQLAGRIAALRGVDLPTLDDAALEAHLRAVLDLTEEGYVVHFRLHGALMMVLGDLASTCRELLAWPDDRWLDLVAGTSATSTAPGRALARIAMTVAERPDLRRLVTDGAPSEVVLAADPEFATEFADYQEEFGCRVLSYELAEESLDERPELVLGLLRDQLTTGYDPARHDEELARRRRAAADEARARLAGRSPADRERFESELRRALEAYPVREDNEFFTMSAPLAQARRAVLEVGSRLASRGSLERPDDVFHLEPGELLESLREGIDRLALVARRRGERAWVLAHPGPASYGRAPSGPPPLSAMPAAARRAMERFLWLFDQLLGKEDERLPAGPGAGAVRGIPASAGTYTGPVRVIRTEAEFDRLRGGDVLVCPVTSPVWSVLFPLVGALVTDAGGTLSHPAIIAREFGVPAVIATRDGTSRLRDGQLVTVDGGTGTVQVRS
ncbi:PEP/pyruvate-binding domain-containing protein [Geodermatophilus sp. URMC 62]|uniref:PEP/pyruvate-binding domain-containing protein n=1 Tax=Geodermatophilus sp. URMC 62 TaxID=3423414 RepID=UPI00406CC0FA